VVGRGSTHMTVAASLLVETELERLRATAPNVADSWEGSEGRAQTRTWCTASWPRRRGFVVVARRDGDCLLCCLSEVVGAG
jgi:hypothetical protein